MRTEKLNPAGAWTARCSHLRLSCHDLLVAGSTTLSLAWAGHHTRHVGQDRPRRERNKTVKMSSALVCFLPKPDSPLHILTRYTRFDKV
ncbi:hypothetical protein E2C01_050018 [Portunus trituberculatus]|uniref:Uncharacterized protein n=1 Tax=Portunus trituberculatus TaxID=210409 RepID=A0A5B7GG42_PORTR|nr:hypothetical protein [Portunus trituberculatus]